MRTTSGTIIAAVTALAAGCFAVCAKELTTSQKVERQIVAASDKVQKKVDSLDDFPVACERVCTVAGQEASLLPKGMKFKLVWHDDFAVDYVRVYDIDEAK